MKYAAFTIFAFSSVFLIVLFGLKESKEYFSGYERKELAMMFAIFISIIFQLFPFEYDSRCLTPGWQITFYFALLLSMALLVLLFRKYEKKPDRIQIIMVLGILQVSVAMLITTSEYYYWNVKLLANMIYLTIPTTAVYFLTRPKEESKAENPKAALELPETETSQSKGEA